MFGGCDKDILGRVLDSKEAEIVNNIMKSIGFQSMSRTSMPRGNARWSNASPIEASRLGSSYHILFALYNLMKVY